MKNIVVFTHLVFVIAYPAAVAADALGVLPLGMLSFPVFVGFYVAAGLLAMFLHDYAPKPPQTPTDVARRARPAQTRTEPIGARAAATLGYHTRSA